MDEAMRQDITELMETANATSRSDFVRQAVKFYCGYLRAGKATNYLSPVVVQAVKSEVESVERNLSRMLFKLAVEVGMQSHLVVATNEVQPDQLGAIREVCAKEIAETNGILTMERADEFQNGGGDA